RAWVWASACSGVMRRLRGLPARLRAGVAAAGLFAVAARGPDRPAVAARLRPGLALSDPVADSAGPGRPVAALLRLVVLVACFEGLPALSVAFRVAFFAGTVLAVLAVLAAFAVFAVFAVFAAFLAGRVAADFGGAASPSTSLSRPSKRCRMSAISSALSALRWLAWPLLPRLLPVAAREASLCFCTRSRARSRAVLARLIRASRPRASSWRRPLIRLSSYSAISLWLSRLLALARVIGMPLLLCWDAPSGARRMCSRGLRAGESRRRGPGVDDRAEQPGGLLGVVQGRVRVRAAPREAGRLHRACKHGLAVGDAGQGHGVEHAEGVEGVALVAAAGDRGIEEVQVEVCVVADQDRALAAVLPDRGAHGGEDVVEGFALGLGEAERMVQVDAGDLQRLRVDVGAGGGHDVGTGRFAQY